jgi:hypothetical protein
MFAYVVELSALTALGPIPLPADPRTAREILR